MKTQKTNFLLLAFILCVAVVAACNDIINLDDYTKKEDNQQEKNSLVGTKWKLVGFYNIEKNELKEPELKDCEDCYTIEFGPDTTVIPYGDLGTDKEYWIFTGKSTLMQDYTNCFHFGAYYIADYTRSTIFVAFMPYPLMQQQYDGEKYMAGIERSTKFKLTDTELKLYYTYPDCPTDCYGYGSITCDSSHIKPFYLLFRRLNNEN